jgi:hypothetical protein
MTTIAHALIVAAVLTAGTIAAAQDIVVKPARISEMRANEWIKKDSLPGGFALTLLSSLNVTLRVEGAAARDATKYGRLKITEAADDTGKALQSMEAHSGVAEPDFISVRDPRLPEPPERTGFDVVIHPLTLAARNATAIRSLKGEFQMLVGGEKKIVTAKDPKSLVGGKLEDPALKEAGVEIEIVKPDRVLHGETVDQADTVVSLWIRGNRGAIQETNLVNAAGETLNDGWHSNGIGGIKMTVAPGRTMDANTMLQIVLMVGQQTVTVPFELKDVKLP